MDMQFSTNPRSELKMIYLSPGNLPSQWAHSIQIAKMAQAFSEKLENFELVTSGDLYSLVLGRTIDFKEWYGLNRDFKITYLPTHFYLKYPLPQDHFKGKFSKLAVLYARLKAPSLVYTRTASILRKSLKLKLPTIAEFHDSFTHKELFTNKYLLGIVTTSEQYAREYIEQGLPANKVLVENNAVDLKMFSPYQTKETARQNVGISGNSPIIVYAGHLYKKKGISTIVRLAQLLPDCHFLLVGGWEEDIKRIQKEYHLEKTKNLEFIGHVPQSQLTSYLYAADILLLPNIKDSAPLKLFEYMATQRPIVASEIPPIQRVLQNKRNAVLAQVEDPISFKEAIQTLLYNPSLARSISQQSFQDVRKMTWEKRADRILQFATEKLNDLC